MRDHPALSSAQEPLDYTEAIAFLSIWAGRLELERVAAEGIESVTDRQQFLREPDALPAGARRTAAAMGLSSSRRCS